MTHQDLLAAKNIDEVVSILDDIIEDSIKHKSRLGYFAALYKRVTVEVRTKIQEGYFDDNERMEKMDVMFANRYFRAYQEYKMGKLDDCNDSWLLAFEAAETWPPLVLQHLFAGMNAHIGLDLGIAAVETQGRENIDGIKNDFMKINAVLSSLVDEVQSELSEIFPLMKPLDKIAGRLDEKIAAFAMDIARDEAWKFALAYAKVDLSERSAFIHNRDKNVASFGKKLVKPGVILRVLLFFFRLFEKGNIVRKIKVLNR